ncbi:hypothetical protein ACHQM5_019795 [Ranunculus cassubicifolius]
MAMATLIMVFLTLALITMTNAASDTNHVFNPCSDTKIQRSDGFTFGIAFSSKPNFFLNQIINASQQLSPCDTRLGSLRNSNSQLSVFRPKIDEISLLTINTTTNFQPDNAGGFMVAFAGRKYAARSIPAFVANNTYIVTSFTLVFEFQKGRLENLYWKRDGCASCSGKSSYTCLNKQDCAIKTQSCKTNSNSNGNVDCSIGIQLAFSGTDKNLKSLNSWYEVEKLRQYSLYGLYSNLKNSLTDQYNKVF